MKKHKLSTNRENLQRFLPTNRLSWVVLFLIFLGNCPNLHAQLFDYRKCLDILTPPPGSGATLCDDNPNFDPELTLGANMNSTTFSSTLPLVQSGSNFFLQNLDIHINGRLLVDQSFLFFNCRVRLGPGAEIITLNNQLLGGFLTQFFSCQEMWKGITIPGGSSGLSLFGCQVEDAEFAVTIAEGVPLSMVSNRFNRNYVGIRNGDGSTLSPGLAVGFFFSNEFTCDADLNPPYTGQANHNNISYAGMTLNNTAGSFGFSNTINTFSNMMYGIVMEKSEVAITRFQFEEMVEDDDEGGIGILATNGILIAVGAVAAFHDNPLSGIEAHGTDLDISSYQFTGTQANGIRSVDNTFAQDILIADNQFTIEANNGTSRGIFLERSIASGNTAHNRILDNTMTINGTSPARAIEIVGINPAIDALIVRDDSIVVNNTNDNVNGIRLSGSNTDNNRIENNQVLFLSPDAGGGRFGINLQSCNGQGNSVTSNQVYGTLDDVDDNRHQCSIHSTGSPGVFYCNNLVEDSERGFHFVQDNDNSAFAANTMRACDRGLFIPFGQIGVQIRRGNIWSTNPNAFQINAAENDAADVDDSRFDIHSTAQQFFPTNNGIDPNNGWFVLLEGDPVFCGGLLLEDKFSPYETKIAQNALQNESFTNAEVWDAEKRLFEKLMTYPDMVEPNSSAEGFFSEKQGTNIEAFAQVAAAMKVAMLPSEIEQSDYDDQLTMAKSHLQQMLSLDAQVQQPQEVVTSFDPTFLDNKNAALQNLASTTSTKKEILSQALQQRVSELSVAWDMNEAIIPNEIHEANLQTMNRFLITLGIGKTLDENDMQTIESIAHQCVREGGQAVQLARMLLPACETIAFYNDEALETCKRSGGHEHDGQRTLKADVFPNPANRELWANFPDEVSGSMELSRADGVLVKTTVLEKAHTAKLDLTGLAPGVYLLSVPLPGGEAEVHKVIVQ